MSFLHVHKRRVPTQDIYRSVVIGMSTETAMQTMESRLVLATLLVNGSAFRTGLRGISGVNGDKFAAAHFQFVSKDGGEGAPALIQDAPVQSRLLADVLARFLDGSLCGCRHVDGLQVFHHHGAESICDVTAGDVVPVFADAGTFRGDTCGAFDGLEAAIGTFLSASNRALCGTVAPIESVKAVRQREHLSGGQRQRVRNAAIYADRRADGSRGFVIDLSGERYVPSQRSERNGGIEKPAVHLTGVTELYPTDLGKFDGTPLRVEFLDFNLAAHEAEGLVNTLLAGLRVFGAPSEEISKGLVEITECLLFASLADSSDPIHLCAEHGEFSALLHIVQPQAIVSVGPPELLSLLQRQIVDESASSRELMEQGFLFLSGLELELTSAMDNHDVGLASVTAELGQERVTGLPSGGAFAFCTKAQPKHQQAAA